VSAQRVALVTGATEGIGKQTAIELLERGLFVIVHGRSEARAREAAEAISSAAKKKDVDVAVADFASLAQVRAMAQVVAKRHPRLDVLLNNAGVYAKKRTLTEDGFELTVGVNHFAHFVLTHLLLDALRASDQGRVVNVASGVHGGGEIDLEDLNLEHGWSGYAAYANSKLMNVLFSNELARRLQNTHITSNALHPGVIATKLLRTGFGGGGASVETGARTTVMVATDPSLSTTTGAYFSDRKKASPSATARDAKLARTFYEKSCELTGTKPLPEPS
jgi:NAD(P)-dependent dehydrogenase (short-subunit alcohol dehydrogenase family)